MGKQLIRSCGYSKCKEKIVLKEKENIVFIEKTSKFYHFNCFLKWYVSNRENKKNEFTETQAIDYFNSNLLENSEKHICQLIIKNNFYTFIQRTYNVPVLTNFIYQRFEEVFSGTYKNMDSSIPVEDLYDMWRRKLNFLLSNSSVRKIDEGMSRVLYDLAIILSKAGSYYAWKEQNKISKKEIEIMNSKTKTNYEELSRRIKKEDENMIIEDIYEEEEEGEING